MNESELASLAARSATLPERLAGLWVPKAEKAGAETIKQRIEHWGRRLNDQDPAALGKRLAFEGLSADGVSSLLGPVQPAPGQPLPEWIETLRAVVSATKTAVLLDPPAALIPEVTSAESFAQFHRPFVQVAAARLRGRYPLWERRLTREAMAELERSLHLRLSMLADATLSIEFALYQSLRAQAPPPWLVSMDDSARPLAPSATPAADFTQELIEDAFAGFFSSYPVLARLLCQTLDFWVESSWELFARLEEDLPSLKRLFPEAASLEKVSAIQTAISDPHHRGRTVGILSFGTSFRLVYKPRGLGFEAAHARLLEWLNQRNPGLTNKIWRVLDQRDYGWVEFASAGPCADGSAAQRYYERAGQQLCLLHALAGSDYHCENVIASGEHPAFVDLEVLFRPRIRRAAGGEIPEAFALAVERLRRSVLYTGLLPSWTVGTNGATYIVSGFGVQSAAASGRACPNLPTLKGAPLLSENYLPEIMRGFLTMYDFLLSHRDELLREDGPLQAFRGHQVRFINRNTLVYHKLLQKAGQTQYLSDGLLRSLEFEALYRPAIQEEGTGAHGQYLLTRAEIAALEIGDYPHFPQSVDSLELFLPDGRVVNDLFDLSGFANGIDRIQNLSEADREEQAGFVRNSFQYVQARGVSPESPALSGRVEAPELVPATRQGLIDAARSIARQLSRQAIMASGSAAWIAPQLMRDSDKYQLAPLGPALYDGQCGIAIFFAAMHRVTGDRAASDLAMAALKSLLTYLDKHEYWMKRIGIGGGSGLGGICYSLALCARLLDDPRLLEAAANAAKFIDSAAIESDQTLDLIGGSAGALLGLLRLHAENKDTTILKRALECGAHLLKQEERVNREDSGECATPYVAGFSHGGASVAYALLRLHAISPNTEFLDGAKAVIKRENRIFLPKEKNWAAWHKSYDLPANAAIMTTWCHGAPGIVLGRLGGLTQLNTPSIQTDLANALETTSRFGLGSIDHCCCGNAGRIEALSTAGFKLNRPELRELALGQAGRIIRLAENDGGYNCFGNLPRTIASPGFFPGLAGIGYTFLRMASPNDLPSVLLFE